MQDRPVIGSVVVKKLDKNITQANIAMGHLGISRENPDYYAVMIMNYILGGGGFSSRLMDNIRDNRGLAYDVHSSFSAQKDPGSFQVWMQTKNESANESIDEIFKELKRIRTEPVSEKELADAKAYLTGSFPLRMDTYAKIAGMLTAIEIYNLGLDYPQKYPGSDQCSDPRGHPQGGEEIYRPGPHGDRGAGKPGKDQAEILKRQEPGARIQESGELPDTVWLPDY